MKTLAERVTKRRTALGLSQGQLAKRVGISQPSIQRIENGGVCFPKNIIEIANVLNCKPEWLLFGAGKAPALKHCKTCTCGEEAT